MNKIVNASLNRPIAEIRDLTDGELDGIAGGRSRLIMSGGLGVMEGAKGSGIVWRRGFGFPPPVYPPC